MSLQRFTLAVHADCDGGSIAFFLALLHSAHLRSRFGTMNTRGSLHPARVPMATFYVLPPRECLEQALSQFCGQVLPGVPVPHDLCEQMLTHWANGLAEMNESLCLHREDLPAGGDMQEDLVDAFGAEPGDEVVEVAWAGGTGPAPAPVRSWTIDFAVSEAESLR